jgi:hypothetical protein
MTAANQVPGVFIKKCDPAASALLEKLNKGVCPDCAAERFNRGPAAGLSINVQCAGCGSKFCVSPPFTPERIDNSDSLYGRENRALFELI